MLLLFWRAHSEITLKNWNRSSDEKRSNVICKPLVQAALQQHVHIVFVNSEFVEVVMEVFDIFVIGYVVADCRVAFMLE